MKIIVLTILIFAASSFSSDLTFVLELRKKMEAGDVDAQIELAKIYDRGKGIVRSDFEEAERLLRSLAVKGNARAQFQLGHLYHPDNGRMRDVDWQRAQKIIDSLTIQHFKSLGIPKYPDSIIIKDSVQKSLDSNNWISKEYWKYVLNPEIRPYGGATLPESTIKRVRDSASIELSSEQWYLKAANQGLPEAM